MNLNFSKTLLISVITSLLGYLIYQVISTNYYVHAPFTVFFATISFIFICIYMFKLNKN